MRRSKGDSASNILKTYHLGNLLWFLGGISIRKSTQTGWVVYRVGLDVFVGFKSILVWFLVVLTRCRKPDTEEENLTG